MRTSRRRLVAAFAVAVAGGALAATLRLDGVLLLTAGALVMWAALAVAGIFDS